LGIIKFLFWGCGGGGGGRKFAVGTFAVAEFVLGELFVGEFVLWEFVERVSCVALFSYYIRV